MAVKLRLRRMGKKKQPFYRIVAADSRAPRNGRFIELVGTYNPIKQPHEIDVQEERIFYWLNNGAQPTRTVQNLLSQVGLWMKWDMMKRGVDEAKIAEELAKWEVLQIEKAKRKEEKAAAKKEAKKEESTEEVEVAEDVAEEPVVEAAEPAEAAAAPVEEVTAEPETVEEVPEEKAEEVKETAPEASEPDPAKEKSKDEKTS